MQAIEAWSISGQLADFTAGVLSLAGAAYFLAILVVMLYVSMVLIGRRHWFSGAGRFELFAHYLVRTLALVLVGAGVVGTLAAITTCGSTPPARSSARSRRRQSNCWTR